MQITEVRLTASDPGAAGRFYAEVMGLPVREHRGGVRVRAGSSEVVLVPGPVGPGVHHLAFTVLAAGFTAAATHLAARVGLVRAGDPRDPGGPEGPGGHDGQTRLAPQELFEGPQHWNSVSVYFPGPDSAVLELIVRRDLPGADLLPASPDGPRGAGPVGSAVACLSEVGVAAPDVFALVGELAATCALVPFGQPSHTFAPVGDQHGLLVCVDARRAWAPQGVHRAHGGPLRIRMTTPAGTATLDLGQDLSRQTTLDP